VPDFLSLNIEVSGCPTSCVHCWARGRHYDPMPFEDIAEALNQAKRACSESGLSFYPYPLHEFLAHPQASEILKLFSETCGTSFEPLLTTGVPLATRDDWADVLETAKSTGTTVVWFTFHGIGDVHDSRVHRQGAFEEVCTAIGRARSLGLRCCCNAFLTRNNLPQFGQMLALFEELNIDEIGWHVADYYPIARLRHAEDHRPELEDLLPLADSIAASSKFDSDMWRDLEAYTESAYVRKALDGREGDPPRWTFREGGKSPDIVCRPNMDVYWGKAGLYGALVGNLRRDDPARVFSEAIAQCPYPDDSLYFSARDIPPIHALVQAFADPEGQRIYNQPASMRNRWLDLALAGDRRY
jgi:MoaA/NifB/PqqE/SkfB family radical SAM enzyme